MAHLAHDAHHISKVSRVSKTLIQPTPCLGERSHQAYYITHSVMIITFWSKFSGAKLYFFGFKSSLLLSPISISYILPSAISPWYKAGRTFAPKAFMLMPLVVRVYYILFSSSLLLGMCVTIILFLNLLIYLVLETLVF